MTEKTREKLFKYKIEILSAAEVSSISSPSQSLWWFTGVCLPPVSYRDYVVDDRQAHSLKLIGNWERPEPQKIVMLQKRQTNLISEYNC